MNSIPASLIRYVQTRDKRIHKLYTSQPKAMTELFEKLILRAWREIVQKAAEIGIAVQVTHIKHGNGWATKCGGFWDEADYCLQK